MLEYDVEGKCCIKKYFDQYSLSTIELNCPFNEDRRNLLSKKDNLMCILLDKGMTFHESKLVTVILEDSDVSVFKARTPVELEKFTTIVEKTITILKNTQQIDLFMTLLLRLFEKIPNSILIFTESQYKNITRIIFDRMCHSSDYSLILCYNILIKLICFNSYSLDQSQIDSLMTSTKVLLHTFNESSLMILKNIKHIFRIKYFHAALFEYKIVTNLLQFCEQTGDIESSYSALFCLWCFSYHSENIVYLHKIRVQFISSLSNVIHNFKKVKILRMALYILNNITSFPELKSMTKSFLSFMAHNGLQDMLQSIIKGKFVKDAELLSIMESLNAKIVQVLNDLSSFEQFQIELSSGHLKNTMMHSNEQFWKNNISKFVGKSDEIQKLMDYLHVSKDNKSINLALEDINLYLKHHPLGKVNLLDLGVKKYLYDLLNHEDTIIKMKALSMLQKLFIK